MRDSEMPRGIRRAAHLESAAGTRTFLSVAACEWAVAPQTLRIIGHSGLAADRNVRAPGSVVWEMGGNRFLVYYARGMEIYDSPTFRMACQQFDLVADHLQISES